MFSRKKKDKSGESASHAQSDASASTSATTPRFTPRGTPMNATPRGVDAEAFRKLRDLLESKCDEVDDLDNNLALAKESLRHLSDRLDKTNEELQRSKQREGALAGENRDLKSSLASVRSMAEQKMDMALGLEQSLLKLQGDLKKREIQLKEDKERFAKQIADSAAELQRREHRIHRLTTCVDGVDDEGTPGRVQVKKLSALLQ